MCFFMVLVKSSVYIIKCSPLISYIYSSVCSQFFYLIRVPTFVSDCSSALSCFFSENKVC